MSQLETLFPNRGSLSRIAREMGCPVNTVHSWKQKGAIPLWRRRGVLDAARRLKLDLPLEVIGYLTQAA